jgi:hypothetical protein
VSTPLDGLARDLAAAGVGDYATDRALDPALPGIVIAGYPATGSGPLVLLTTYPGIEPDSRNGWEFPRMQVRVRADDPLEALALDRAAYTVLQFTPGGPGPRVLPGPVPWWLQDCHALQSEAQPLGMDANGRHEFTRNYQLTANPA